MASFKHYIRIWVDISPDGKVTPHKMEWDDGTRYPIDRVLSCHRCHFDGSTEITERYEVLMYGQRRYLYREVGSGRWFVEQTEI